MNNVDSTGAPRAREQAGSRTSLLAVVCLLAVIGVGTFWLYRTKENRAANVDAQEAGGLSAATQEVLHQLKSPVEIRFYALLDPASVSDSLKTLAERVDQLLSKYQQAAGGRIKVTRYNSWSNANRAAAGADGMKPFNLDKGDACYLGLVLVQNGKKESFSHVTPEWEQALESDLSRGIARLANASSSSKTTVASPQLDTAAIAEVKRQVPNFASVSVEEATQVLRESALKDFKAAVSEMEIQLKEAEQRVSQTQSGNSEAEQQSAMKLLKQLQAEQAEKLKQIAARSMAQIEALRRLKEPAR